MSYKKYEESLKGKLSQYTHDIDDSDMWDNIEPHLPKKSKKRIAWFIFGFSLLATTLIAWKYTTPSVNSITQQLNTDLTTSFELESGLYNQSQNNATQVDLENDDKSIHPNVQTIDSPTRTNTTSSNLIRPILSRSANSKNITYQQNANNLDRLPTQQSQFSNNSAYSYNLSSKTKTSSTLSLQNNTLLSSQLKSQSEVNSTPNRQAVIIQSKEAIGLADRSVLDLLSIEPLAISNSEYSPEGSLVAHTDNKNNRWYLRLSLEYADLKQSHMAVNPESQTLTNLRSTLENTFESISIGAHAEYQLNQDFSVSAGLEFYRYQTSSINSQFFEDIIEFQDIIAVFERRNGTTTEVEQGIFTATNTRNWRRITTSSNITIPFMINYHIGLTENNSLTLGLGFRKGILNWTRGFEQDLDLTEYNLSTDLENRLRSSGQDHVLFNLNWKTQFENNSSFSIGLRYAYDQSGIYNSNFSIQKNIHHLGIQTSYALPLK